MNRNMRIALSLACLFSIYAGYLYLEVAWAALSKPFVQYYVFPFVAVHQQPVFGFWVNFISLLAFICWGWLFVQYVRDR